MSGAVRGAGPHIVDFLLGFPDERWAGWQVGAQPGEVAAQLAGRLADGPEAQDLVRRSVMAVNADAQRKAGSVPSVGIWVPDRSTGEVVAILSVSIRATEGDSPSPEAYLARNLRRDMGRGTKILECAQRLTDLPVGPTAIEQLVLRLRGERQVQSYLFFLIFPTGAREALRLSFNTVHLNLLNTIAEQARIIADSLTVTLGEIPGGRPKGR